MLIYRSLEDFSSKDSAATKMGIREKRDRTKFVEPNELARGEEKKLKNQRQHQISRALFLMSDSEESDSHSSGYTAS